MLRGKAQAVLAYDSALLSVDLFLLQLLERHYVLTLLLEYQSVHFSLES